MQYICRQCLLPGITKTVADLKVRELSPFLATKQMQVPLSSSVTSSSDRILTQASLLTLISLTVGRIWQRLSLTFKILASEVNVASWLTCFNHLMCGVSCDLRKYESFYASLSTVGFNYKPGYINHGLRTHREEIAFTVRPKIQSQSQIFRYSQSIFCLPHRPIFSDIFDLCLHWVSLVRGIQHWVFCKILVQVRTKFQVMVNRN